MQTGSKEQAWFAVGIVLWALGCLAGVGLLLLFFVVLPLGEKNPLLVYQAEVIGLVIALPAACVYMFVPMIVDRYEPEPWWSLAMAFLWGATAAAGFSCFVNTAAGITGGVVTQSALGEMFVSSVISAPFTEEAFKALAIVGCVVFMRRQFDGVVDGVVYGTIAALGFAMSENAIYYSRGLLAGGGAFEFQFIFRGVLQPWGHPLYTAMTGIGIGWARESPNTFVKFAAPIGGYLLAVGLHMLWNLTAVLSSVTGVPLVLLTLLAYFVVLILFTVLLMVLVVREGRALRANLQDEVYAGLLSQEHLDFTISFFGTLRARLRSLLGLGPWPAFVHAIIRLGMTKWHVARAAKGSKQTMSYQHIAPLRAAVADLRAKVRS